MNSQLSTIAILCIIGSLSILGLAMDAQPISAPTGAAAYFSEPTYCTYDKTAKTTAIECSCGRATFGRSSSIRYSDLVGRQIEAKGDLCLLRQQRDICSEVCKYSDLALLRRGYVPAPSGLSGVVKLVSVGGQAIVEINKTAMYITPSYSSGYPATFPTYARPRYYPGHIERAQSGAYSYIDDELR